MPRGEGPFGVNSNYAYEQLNCESMTNRDEGRRVQQSNMRVRFLFAPRVRKTSKEPGFKAESPAS